MADELVLECIAKKCKFCLVWLMFFGVNVLSYYEFHFEFEWNRMKSLSLNDELPYVFQTGHKLIHGWLVLKRWRAILLQQACNHEVSTYVT